MRNNDVRWRKRRQRGGNSKQKRRVYLRDTARQNVAANQHQAASCRCCMAAWHRAASNGEK